MIFYLDLACWFPPLDRCQCSLSRSRSWAVLVTSREKGARYRKNKSLKSQRCKTWGNGGSQTGWLDGWLDVTGLFKLRAIKGLAQRTVLTCLSVGFLEQMVTPLCCVKLFTKTSHMDGVSTCGFEEKHFYANKIPSQMYSTDVFVWRSRAPLSTGQRRRC